MTKLITISVIAVAILLAGTAVVYAQATDDTALRQIPMWGDNGDGTTGASNFDEMVDVCVTAGGIDPAQAQEHLQNMEEHMGDGTWQEYMQDGTHEQHMQDGTHEQHMQDGTYEQHMQDGTHEQHMQDGTYENHMGGGAYEDYMGNGSYENHMGGGQMGM